MKYNILSLRLNRVWCDVAIEILAFILRLGSVQYRRFRDTSTHSDDGFHLRSTVRFYWFYSTHFQTSFFFFFRSHSTLADSWVILLQITPRMGEDFEIYYRKPREKSARMNDDGKLYYLASEGRNFFSFYISKGRISYRFRSALLVILSSVRSFSFGPVYTTLRSLRF